MIAVLAQTTLQAYDNAFANSPLRASLIFWFYNLPSIWSVLATSQNFESLFAPIIDYFLNNSTRDLDQI
jgi:hypothetical protein